MSTNPLDIKYHWFYRVIQTLYVVTLTISILLALILCFILFDKGAWLQIILITVGALLLIYAVLNLTKETLFYLVFGKKFSWGWVFALFDLFKDQINWTKNPACFERQLQRRYKNNLFPPEKRTVSQKEVNDARRRDIEDINNLIDEIKKFFAQLPKELGPDFNEVLNQLRQKLEELEDRAYEVGGEAIDLITLLEDERRRVIEAWRMALSYDPDAVTRLDNAEKYHNENYRKLNNGFMRQSMRSDSPIKDDLYPSIFSEDINTIKIFFSLYSKDDAQKIIRVEGLRLLCGIFLRNEDISVFSKKLLVLGLSEQDLRNVLHEAQIMI